LLPVWVSPRCYCM